MPAAETASVPWPAAAACGPPRRRLPPGECHIALVTRWCNSGVVGGGVIGRDLEFGYVAALLAQLEDGPDAVVFAGEPGIGKTTVLLAAERAQASPAVVLSAHPVEAEAELGFAASRVRAASCSADASPPSGSTATAALAISAAPYASSQYLGLPLTHLASLTTDWALGLLPIPVQPIRQPCAVLHLHTVLAALTACHPVMPDRRYVRVARANAPEKWSAEWTRPAGGRQAMTTR